VEQVDFTVYNRWGRPVYTYSSAPNKSVSIDWDGHSDNGNQLESGEYFYVADVTFQVIEADKKKKKYKGWIHLLR
jgi:hypothetical protein